MKLSVAEKASGSRICLAGLGFTTRKDVTWIRLAEMVELFVISLSFFFFLILLPLFFYLSVFIFFRFYLERKLGVGKQKWQKLCVSDWFLIQVHVTTASIPPVLMETRKERFDWAILPGSFVKLNHCGMKSAWLADLMDWNLIFSH